jgi:hypothetical protein
MKQCCINSAERGRRVNLCEMKKMNGKCSALMLGVLCNCTYLIKAIENIKCSTKVNNLYVQIISAEVVSLV